MRLGKKMADIINPLIVENNGDLIHITAAGERKGIPDPSRLLPENPAVGDIPIRKGGGGGIDANTRALFHFDEASGFFIEAVTNSSDVVTSDALYNSNGKFSGCAEFNGSQRIKYTDTSRVYWGTGTGTVDGWMYAYDSPNNSNALVATPGGWKSGGISIGFDRSNSRQKFTIWLNEASGDCAFTSEETYERNTWHHWALVRSEPTKLLFFVDGTLIGTVNVEASRVIDWANGGSYTVIGYNEADSQGFKGRIDELRFSNVARWTSNFEPPTSPYEKSDEYWGTTTAKELMSDAVDESRLLPDPSTLSSNSEGNVVAVTKRAADASTIRLMHFNAGFSDSITGDLPVAATNVSLQEPGKFGKSLYFNGNPPSDFYYPALSYSPEKWTIDFWIYLTQYQNSQSVAYLIGTTLNEEQASLLRINSDGIYVEVGYQSSIISGGDTVSLNEWHHIAVTYADNTYKCYLDGNLYGSQTTDKKVYFTRSLWIGSFYAYNGDYTMRGMIDEFRISNIVRWESNFTPPAKEYEGGMLSYAITDPAEIMSVDESRLLPDVSTVPDSYAGLPVVVTSPDSPILADATYILFLPLSDDTTDYSQNQLDVTLFNTASMVNGSPNGEGKSLRLVAESCAYVTLPSPLATGDFTFSAWVNFDNNSSKTVCSTRSGDSTSSNAFSVSLNDGKLSVYADGGKTSTVDDYTPFTFGELHNVKVVR